MLSDSSLRPRLQDSTIQAISHFLHVRSTFRIPNSEFNPNSEFRIPHSEFDMILRCPVGAPEDTRHEGLRRRQHPKRRARRPQRIRQDPARLGHPRSTPAWSTASARSTKARRSPITTKKKSPASTRCRPASPTPSGTSTKINLIDTPGMGNFLERRARRAARRRRRAGRRRRGRRRRGADREGLGRRPRSSACRGSSSLNRLDRERASLERTLASLREACSRTVIPIQLPIGEETSVHAASSISCR